jgi:hypothetical protein
VPVCQPQQAQLSNQIVRWHQKCHTRLGHEAVTRANLPRNLSGDYFVRREDLLKPDVMSEIILLGAGALIFVILMLILIVVLTESAAPI